MAEATTTQHAARMMRHAARRRADGSRGIRARWAWWRLIRACAVGDRAAQEAVRAAELPDVDVLELLAAGPEEPPDRAAYLTLIGQREQRQAMDPDGAQLALAYWAATSEARERLRAAMAAEGDVDVVRVVVGGEQRDRAAGMSYEDLDHLGHRLAEHERFDELRRLALDLPLPKAVAAARLLPERERAGNTTALAALAELSPRGLRNTVGRLPREREIAYSTGGSCADIHASFSPDSGELAVQYTQARKMELDGLRVDTVRIGTGEGSPRLRQSMVVGDDIYSVLHLGEEILLRRGWSGRGRLVRLMPGRPDLRYPRDDISQPRRSSRGAVLATPTGLAFVDHGEHKVRYREVPQLARWNNGPNGRGVPISEFGFGLTTLPEAGLVALFTGDEVLVLDEEGTVLHEITDTRIDFQRFRGTGTPALSFLSATSLALHRYLPVRVHGPVELSGQLTEIWDLPPGGPSRCIAEHRAAIRERWPLETWRGTALDDYFAVRILISDPGDGMLGGIDEDIVPWRDAQSGPVTRFSRWCRTPIAVAPWGDMIVTVWRRSPNPDLKVHSPHLPTARELLERPLLHQTPRDLKHVRELLPLIGDPEVREALDALAACLVHRFGGEIALGDGPVSAGGPQDIALSDGGTSG